MAPFRLLAQFAAWAIAFVAFNFGVAALAQHSVPRQVLTRIDSASGTTDLFVGNSLVQAGIDVAAFEAVAPGRQGLNAGLGASSPIEHVLLLRRALAHDPVHVHYGFFDGQLTDPIDRDWWSLEGNRAMAYYADPDAAADYYVGDATTARIVFFAAGHFPAFVERRAVWARVERVRRSLAGLGMPASKANRFGAAEDFTLLEAVDADAFRRRCVAAAKGRAPLAPPVADLFERCRRAGAAATVIEMPMPAAHRRRFYENGEWRAYRRHLMRQIARHGGRYVVASDWIADAGFADPLHLNDAGAKIFSRRYAAEVVR